MPSTPPRNLKQKEKRNHLQSQSSGRFMEVVRVSYIGVPLSHSTHLGTQHHPVGSPTPAPAPPRPPDSAPTRHGRLGPLRLSTAGLLDTPQPSLTSLFLQAIERRPFSKVLVINSRKKKNISDVRSHGRSASGAACSVFPKTNYTGIDPDS